jgi:hypothetical protein
MTVPSLAVQQATPLAHRWANRASAQHHVRFIRKTDTQGLIPRQELEYDAIEYAASPVELAIFATCATHFTCPLVRTRSGYRY